MRHVQKQHGDSVSPQQIEDCIRVNDLAASASADDEEDIANSNSDDDMDSGADQSEQSLSDVGGNILSSTAIKQMPVFHPAFGAMSMARLMGYPKILPDQNQMESTTSMLRQQLQLPPAKPSTLARNVLGSKAFVNAAKSAVSGFDNGIKQEVNEEEYTAEQPLDFSMKPTTMAGAATRRLQSKMVDGRLLDLSGKTQASAGIDSDEPMDLSKATRGTANYLSDASPLTAGGVQFNNKTIINPQLLPQATTRHGRPSSVSQFAFGPAAMRSLLPFAAAVGRGIVVPPHLAWLEARFPHVTGPQPLLGGMGPLAMLPANNSRPDHPPVAMEVHGVLGIGCVHCRSALTVWLLLFGLHFELHFTPRFAFF